MAKKRVHIKGFLIFFAVAAAMILSYAYGRQMYAFYIKNYFEKIRGITQDDQLRTATVIYDDRDYERAADLLRTLTLVYPENSEIQTLYGRTLIRLGEGIRGADMILLASDGRRIPEGILEETVRALFTPGHYRDVLHVFKNQVPGHNPNLLYYLGVALYETGDYDGAIEFLAKAAVEGKRDHESFHYLGRAYYMKGDTLGALPYLERARDMNVEDPRIARSLAHAYRKLGRYDESARLLQGLKQAR